MCVFESAAAAAAEATTVSIKFKYQSYQWRLFKHNEF
jgi:hypothetical protein